MDDEFLERIARDPNWSSHFGGGGPSSRLRNDLEGLIRWAAMAPPDADECDWGWRYYAERVASTLVESDREFAALQAKTSE